MKLKRIYSDIIPFKGYIALTVFPWVFIRNSAKQRYTPTANRHEITHGYQQIEALWILFFVIYGLEYLIKIFICGFDTSRAYHSISFEQEAYANQGNVEYNSNRKHYAWVNYIFKLNKK